MTTLAIHPEFPDFDIHRALGWIDAEADWVSLRFVQENTHRRSVRNGRPERNTVSFDRGVMVEAIIEGQLAYAGTSDLSEAGVRAAARRAARLARVSATAKAMRFDASHRPPSQGRFVSRRAKGLDSHSLAELTDRLMIACRNLKASDRIVNAFAAATVIETTFHYVSSSGADIAQDFLALANDFAATAQDGGDSQRRSSNCPIARCRQAGLEAWDSEALYADCERVGREALDLLAADNCPNATLDLVLSSDQMLLQIHESIGHPLELDRILGDERNYAGWSFVKPEDFGSLCYGSSLMNVTFDPTAEGQFATYAYDDCGHAASREYLIKEGVLLRGLGSLESQARLGIPGVANFRSASWNRAPIDRMGNINLEPGSSSFEELLGAVEHGIYMETNRSWSIDDYRNKFQFGCEYARLIEHGRLTKVLKNPNYRGVTVPFWNKLKAVGHAQEAFGTPYCGKGEPSQVIRVGHASPPCLFSSVDVFGGDA